MITVPETGPLDSVGAGSHCRMLSPKLQTKYYSLTPVLFSSMWYLALCYVLLDQEEVGRISPLDSRLRIQRLSL